MAIEWTESAFCFDGITFISFYGRSNDIVIAVDEIATSRNVKTGMIGLRVHNGKTGYDILRTMHIPADPGEDPCATARAKAEEFVKLFNL